MSYTKNVVFFYSWQLRKRYHFCCSPIKYLALLILSDLTFETTFFRKFNRCNLATRAGLLYRVAKKVPDQYWFVKQGSSRKFWMVTNWYVLDNQGSHLNSFKISLESIRSFRRPLFPKSVTGYWSGIFFPLAWRPGSSTYLNRNIFMFQFGFGTHEFLFQIILSCRHEIIFLIE